MNGRTRPVGLLILFPLLLFGCMSDAGPAKVDVAQSFYDRNRKPEQPAPPVSVVKVRSGPLRMDPRLRRDSMGGEQPGVTPIKVDTTRDVVPEVAVGKGPRVSASVTKPKVLYQTTAQWVERFARRNSSGAAERKRLAAMLEAFHLLLGGRQDEGIERLKEVPPAKDDFQRNMLYAMLLRELGESKKALPLLEKLVVELRSQVPLVIDSPLLAKSVVGMGRYQKFKQYVFGKSQEVILYFEPRNFACLPTKSGEYETRLKIDIIILDAEDREKKRWPLPMKHVTKTRLLDLYVCTRSLVLPRLAAGKYTMKISVKDLGKPDSDPAEEELVFRVKA